MSMSAIEIHEAINRKRSEVIDRLNASDKGGADYAKAFGEMNIVAAQAAALSLSFDPLYSMLSYQQIIDREA